VTRDGEEDIEFAGEEPDNDRRGADAQRRTDITQEFES
jgi:hypothetical protein